MKIGLCTPTRNLEKVKEIGYDYIEVAGVEIAAMTEEAFEAFARRRDALDFPVMGLNAYCNDQTPMVGEGFSEEKVRAYAEKVCRRGARLGIRNIGVGSPGARILPEGYDQERAKAQCRKFLEITADEAGKYGICVLFETLHDRCCNFMNHTKETVQFVQSVRRENVQMVLDFYHMRVMGEDITDLKDIMPVVRHLHCCHIPAGTINMAYLVPEDEEMLRQIREAVVACGYDGTISVEPFDTPDFEQAAATTFQIMKKIFQ